MSTENTGESTIQHGVTAAIEDLDEVSKRIKVSISADTALSEFDSLLNRLSGSVSIKGFRPGKAPKQVVEKLHGDYIRSEVAEKLISSSLPNIIKSHSLSTVGMPSLDVTPWKRGEVFEYVATIALYPRPAVGNYKGLSVTAAQYEVSESEIEKAIERILKSKATLKRLEFRDTAQSGDVIDAQIQVTVAGESEGRSEPVKATLGEGEIAPELEQGIVGMKVGESTEIPFTFPENHRNQNLRGKSATYKVSLTALFERVLPTLDDDFVKSLEIDVATALELRMKVRSSLEEEFSRRTKAEAEVAVLDALVSQNEFAVPQVLVDEEIKSLVVRSGVMDPSQVDLRTLSVEPFRAGLGDIAAKRVRTAVMVDRIAELESITATDQDLEDHIKSIAADNRVSEEDVRSYMGADGRMNDLRAQIVRGKAVAWLLEQSSVTYTPKEPEAAAIVSA